MNVIFPSTLDYNTTQGLLDALDASTDVDGVEIDFSQLRFSLPTAMLVVGSKLREWIRHRNKHGYAFGYTGINSGIGAHSYLMHLGFFDFVYSDQGKNVGEARGSSRYVPIKRITRPTINVPLTGVRQWYDEIQAEARQVAAVLVGSYNDSEELRTYTYCIREIIRNVFEHSQAEECYIVGQRWNNGHVEVALVDEGVGICNTLKIPGVHRSDAETLVMATQAGVSRTNQLRADQNIYDNSGFGLFVLTQLAANFGWFALGSGTAQLVGHKHDRFEVPSSFSGTYFGMRLFSPPNDFSSVLADIIEAGEQEAKAAGINAKASGQSRLVGVEH